MWNLPTLIGILLFGIPLEDLLFAFAFAFGLCWAGVYEQVRDVHCDGFRTRRTLWNCLGILEQKTTVR